MIFQHQYKKQVKMCISLFLFNDWFPLEHGDIIRTKILIVSCLEFVFLFNISVF